MSKQFFVYYQDGYFDDGDIDIESFDSEQDALDFILERIKRSGKELTDNLLDNYRLIEGQEIQLVPKKVVVELATKKEK